MTIALIAVSLAFAMSGAAIANRRRINTRNVFGILRGWLISPLSGFALCLLAYRTALAFGAK